MAFKDFTINTNLLGKKITGLDVTKTGPMRLEVAVGSVLFYNTGQTFTMASGDSHIFSADSSNIKTVFMGVVGSGSAANVWIDRFVDDETNERALAPSGYKLIAELAWFDIAVDETNLNNSTINRRVYL